MATLMAKGTIEYVKEPETIGYIVKQGDKQGQQAEFTKYAFKLSDDQWYETTRQSSFIVKGSHVEFTYEREPWKNNPERFNNKIEDFIGEPSQTYESAIANAPHTPQVASTGAQVRPQVDVRQVQIQYGRARNGATDIIASKIQAGIGYLGDISDEEVRESITQLSRQLYFDEEDDLKALLDEIGESPQQAEPKGIDFSKLRERKQAEPQTSHMAGGVLVDGDGAPINEDDTLPW